MTPTPTVTLRPDALDGWVDFERWAICNVPEWHDVMDYARVTGCSHQRAMQYLAYLMTTKARTLGDKIVSDVREDKPYTLAHE